MLAEVDNNGRGLSDTHTHTDTHSQQVVHSDAYDTSGVSQKSSSSIVLLWQQQGEELAGWGQGHCVSAFVPMDERLNPG